MPAATSCSVRGWWTIVKASSRPGRSSAVRIGSGRGSSMPASMSIPMATHSAIRQVGRAARAG